MTGSVASPLPTFTFAPGDLPIVLPTAVYIARDADGTVIYVGITGSLSARFAAHQKADLWWPAATSITVEMWPTRDSAAKREAWLIEHLDPPHNLFHRPDGRQAERLAERQRREAILVEMYGQGAHLGVIAAAMGVSYTACSNMVTELRKAGRLGRRPKPPARRWVQRPGRDFVPESR